MSARWTARGGGMAVVQSRGPSRMAHDQLANVAGEDFAMPLTIGATGHRDLRPEDIPRLVEAVAGVLGALRAACPDTPFVVISPLAEGADQLVARVALE